MSDELDKLIDDFFAALRSRDLEACYQILRAIECLSHKFPAALSWFKYCTGVLVFEDHRDCAKAEQIFTSLLCTDLDLPMRRRAQIALGRCLDAQGQWKRAVAAFEESLPLSQQLGEPDEQAKAWKNMAISYSKGFTHGDLDSAVLEQALACCQSALDLLEPISAPPEDILWLKGSIWSVLGLIHRDLSQWDQALSCHQRDLAVCQSLDDRFGAGLAYGNIGEIYHRRGRDTWSQALDAYQQAWAIIRKFNDRYEEVEVLSNLGFLYQEMGQDDQSLGYYQQAMNLIEGLRVGVSTEQARAGFFATVVDTFANAILLCVETGNDEMAFDIVERVRSRAFLDVLAAGSPNLPQEMEAVPMTLRQVQAALPQDALLLEYFTTGLVEAHERQGRVTYLPRRHRFPPAKTLIFAVTSNQVQVHDAALSPNDLLPQRLDSVVERHFLDDQIRRTLYARLIAPIAALVSRCQRLYLIPHGPLHYIPFQALLDADDETLLRPEGPPLIYAPSATVLLRRRPEVGSPTASCLALGYNGEGPVQLRLAEEEAISVARQMDGWALVGPGPKKAALYAEGGQCRTLHFSCHGEFLPQAPLLSRLHLSPDEDLTAIDILEHLHLSCDLVTLSACESGLNRVRRGDELVGLMRAFLYAGAHSLISTLWRVDERSTRILMARLYQQLQAGEDPAQALKQAQLDLQMWGQQDDHPFGSPFHWAPFTLVGDPTLPTAQK